MITMKKIITEFWCQLIFILLAFSCNTKDADNVEGPVVYNPTISFPIGTYNLTCDKIFSNMDLPLTDTVEADSLYLLWFEDQFYNDTLGQYDTTIITTFSFDFTNNDEEVIKSILFRFNYLSELPSKSYLQLYFDGVAGMRMDSLFSDGPLLVEPADTNAEGFVESADLRQKDVYFDESKLDMIRQVEQIELNVGIQTRRSDIEYFKYLARYRIYVQLGVRVEFEAEFK
jgi:hypothetical protein